MTKAMPFLQKAILLSYDPRRFCTVPFIHKTIFFHMERSRITRLPEVGFGRRTTLLHLSGFPCQYHRRVDCTKSSTSKPILIL